MNVLERKLLRMDRSKQKLKNALKKSNLNKGQMESVSRMIDGETYLIYTLFFKNHFVLELPEQLYKRMEGNGEANVISKEKYSPQLRTFALTLNFLSPKTYNYIRQQFKNALPHPRTIGKWYSAIDSDVGINKEALKAIEFQIKNKPDLLMNLVFDEMSVRKQLDFDGEKNIGFVDLGDGCEADGELARNVLVFMVVAVNANWKIPIAYYFVNQLNATEKANILLQVHLFNKFIFVINVGCICF